MTVNPIPDDYPRMSPSAIVDGAADAIDWYKKVLGATQRGDVFTMADGRVGHAELAFGDSVLMLGDPFPEMGYKSAAEIGDTAVTLSLYVEDVDATYAAAIAAGATSIREPEDQFYGQRSAQFTDPWGQRWSVGAVIEIVSDEEMLRRVAAFEG